MYTKETFRELLEAGETLSIAMKRTHQAQSNVCGVWGWWLHGKVIEVEVLKNPDPQRQEEEEEQEGSKISRNRLTVRL
jgi:hypothetical protein